MTYPSTREQDEFLGTLGIDPFKDSVEVVTIHTHDGQPMTALYSFERNGEICIACHWPGDHEDIT